MRQEIYSYPVTIILIIINTIVFGLVHFDVFRVEQLGSSYAATIKKKQYYRILTSAFTQKEYLHFGMNMISLYNIGSIIESVFSPGIYALCYMTFVIFGGAISASLKKNRHPFTYSIGASGAICGLLGVYIVLAITVFGMRGIASVIPTLILLGVMTFSKNIDSIGHFTGLALGIIAGIIYVLL